MCKHKNSLRQYSIVMFSLTVLAMGCLLVFSYWGKVTPIVLAFYIGSFAFLFAGKRVSDDTIGNLLVFSGIFIFLTTLLFQNYIFNIMQPHNNLFGTFQADSEQLVRDAMLAILQGEYEGPFGLGHYADGFNGYFSEYVSQYGLQGKVFVIIAKLLGYNRALLFSNELCALLTAVIFVMITLLIRKKWGNLMSVCYYLTFWLSPWIVNFARNLYWVEFTWFIPALLGLFCSVYVDKKSCIVFSVAGVFVSVLIKSLCGYEYISTIMLAMIAFLLLDIVKAMLDKNRKKAWMLFKVAFTMGLAAVLGFVCALLIHASIRGGGNITAGLELIYTKDVMRRMSVNSDPAMFDSVYAASLQAGVRTVLRRYFCFTTDILLGLDGKLFCMLTLLPILFFVLKYVKNAIDWNDVSMYIVLYLTCISWFVVATPHSYIHVHMNYVLWYFGYVQVCLYLICKYILSELRERNII